MNTAAETPSSFTDGTQSLRRACSLLAALARMNQGGGSAMELAQRTGLNRTTAHRMLRCLQEEGLLRYVPASHRYFLGPVAYEIGIAAAGQVKLRAICAPAIARIARETGDTVFLMERERYDSVCIDRAEGSYPVKTLVMSVGDRRPLGVGAGALAMLAAMDDAEDAIAHNAQRYSDWPGLTLRKLRRSLAEARERGNVRAPAIGVEGVRAVGIALCTPAGRALGAISIAAVEHRMSDRRAATLIELLEAEAQALRESLAGI